MSLDVLVIVGPTACGKTRLGVEVAHRLGSEIVSADSRQVYRGLDIGTGKDLGEYSKVDPPVPYHLIDVANPSEVYTLFRYQQDCYRLFREMEARAPFVGGAVPAVMVGGSGLYVEAVVGDYRLADVPNNAGLRAYLQERETAELAHELQRRSPELARNTDMSSKRRLIRALEIAEYGEVREVEYGEAPGVPLRFTVFAIEASRAQIRGRIRDRLRARLEEGMIEEVQDLLDDGFDPRRLRDLGLEYREIASYLLGEKSRDRMLEDLEIAIAGFAKRQQTWFRGMERRGTPIRWIEAGDVDAVLRGYGNDREVS